MSVETALYPSQLNTAWPLASDMVSEGDDHIRVTKTVIKTTFPNVAGAINATDVQINYLVGVTSSVQNQIDGKGSITGQNWSGPHVFGGSVAVPTLAQATSTTGAASTAFVQNEWTARLPNYTGPITASTTELNYLIGVSSGVQAQINTKGAIGGQIWSGTHVFPSTTTVGPLTPTIQGYLATATSDIQAQINAKASKSGEIYTGTHNFTGATVNVATATTGSAGSAAASLDFVNATALSGVLPGQAGNAGKVITTNGTNASWSNVLTSYLSGPAGATGAQFPQAQEVVPRAPLVYGKSTLMGDLLPGTTSLLVSTTGRGSDWPIEGTDFSVQAWDVNTTGSAGRLEQTATQVLFAASGQIKGSRFMRVLHDTVWSDWDRVITGRTMMDSAVVVNVPSGTPTYSLDPSLGSMHVVTINNTCTFNLPTPRQIGDSVVLHMISAGGIRAVAFSANINLPKDGSGAVLPFPTYPANGRTSLLFEAVVPGSWDCYYSGGH